MIVYVETMYKIAVVNSVQKTKSHICILLVELYFIEQNSQSVGKYLLNSGIAQKGIIRYTVYSKQVVKPECIQYENIKTK